MVDYFDQPIAVDPTANDGEGALVPGAEFEVFAGTDLSFTTPLTVFEAVSGAEINPLVSSSVAQLPQFRVEGDPEFVILKSGQFEVRLRSVFGAAKQAVADAGLSPEVIAEVFQAKDDVEGLAADVTTAVGTATDAATAAGDFATAASAAASEAQTSKEAVQAVVATSDGIMAPILASPTTASGAALRATIDERVEALVKSMTSLRPTSNLAVAIGDSRTEQGTDSTDKIGGEGWFGQLTAMSRQRIRWGGIYATGGFTVEQIRDTHLPSVLARTGRDKPGSCFILAGTNNEYPASGSWNFAAYKSAYLDILTALLAAGIVPIICLDTPVTNGTGVEQQANRWLIDIAQRLGLAAPLDFYSALVNPATGGLIAEYAVGGADTKHPNRRGYKRMASYALSQGIASYFPPAPALTARSAVDPISVFPFEKALFLGDTDANGVANGWAVNGTGSKTTELVAGAPQGVAGNWQKITRTAPLSVAGNVTLVTNPVYTIAHDPGDIFAASCRIRTSGIEAAGGKFLVRTSLTGWELRLAYNWTTDADPGADGQGIVVYAEKALPAGITDTTIDFQVVVYDPTGSGTITVEIAECKVVNLTKQGILT